MVRTTSALGLRGRTRCKTRATVELDRAGLLSVEVLDADGAVRLRAEGGMKLALVVALLAPAVAAAEPGDAPAATDSAPAEQPSLLPEPAYAPDPIAIDPAGPSATLCRYGSDCRATAPAAPAAPPLSAAATVAGARLAYSGHPSRTGGDELVARVDLWRGPTWSALFGYTVDSIDSTTTTGAVTTRYHDALVGARIALPFDRPTWVAATGHLMSGTPDATGSTPTAMGNGGAGYLALGQRYASVDLESRSPRCRSTAIGA